MKEIMTPYRDFKRRKDGFYTYELLDGQRRWGYEKEYRGARRKREGFATKEKAQRDRQDWMNLVDAGYGDSANLTILQLATAWLTAHAPRIKQTTLEGYERDLKNHILPVLGEMKLPELRPAHIEELLSELASGTYKKGRKGEEHRRTNRTANKALAPLRAMLSFAVRTGCIQVSPAACVPQLPERPAERRFLSVAEAQLLLASCEGQAHALIATTLGTGLRRGEVMGLRWEDMDLDRSLLTVRRTIDNQGRIGTPKDHQVRAVTLPEWLRLTLIDFWRAEESPAESWVFHTSTGQHLEGGHLYRRIFQPALKKAGLSINFHGLRHSYATIALDAGAIPLTISGLLGHENPETMHRFYAHQVEDADRRKEDVDRWLSGLSPRIPHDYQGEQGEGETID
ncbi:MAG: tyrosine-type recombinase/integrase [Candidatus Geothermincolia bacterium]